MSDQPASVDVLTEGPSYLLWRGDLLAELALARLPELIVHKRPDRLPAERAYDFLAATGEGFCFFVVVRAFSSLQLDLEDVATVPELRWAVDADTIRRARRSHSPVILFLFDADTEHGRYLRLDILPEPGPKERQLTVRPTAASAITRASLEKLIADLQGTATS